MASSPTSFFKIFHGTIAQPNATIETNNSSQLARLLSKTRLRLTRKVSAPDESSLSIGGHIYGARTQENGNQRRR